MAAPHGLQGSNRRPGSEDGRESETVRQAIIGDEAAFLELYRKHFGRVFRLALYYLRSVEDAEDIAQETFTKAYRGLRSFDAGMSAGFAAWLNRICLNCVIDHQRKVKRTSGRGVIALDDLTCEPAAPGPSPEDAAVAALTMSSLEDHVDGLSPRQRVIFALRYRQHLDVKQIAGRLECTEGNVRLHLFRSTIKLRHCVSAASPAV
jgi:RNA polymerase sigma-70 factor (ECF subfamily)